MNRKGFFVSKTLVLITLGAVLLLLFTTGFLVKERSVMQEQTRQLIIQNDSVMSVNLVLSDSLKGMMLNEGAKRTVLTIPIEK